MSDHLKQKFNSKVQAVTNSINEIYGWAVDRLIRSIVELQKSGVEVAIKPQTLANDHVNLPKPNFILEIEGRAHLLYLNLARPLPGVKPDMTIALSEQTLPELLSNAANFKEAGSCILTQDGEASEIEPLLSAIMDQAAILRAWRNVLETAHGKKQSAVGFSPAG